MSVTTDVGVGSNAKGKKGMAFYLADLNKYFMGMGIVLATCLFFIYWQQTYGHTYGLDAHSPVFDKWFMNFLYAELMVLSVIALAFWGWLWTSRDRNLDKVAPKEELRRYVTFMAFLSVYTFTVYWAASYFAEQDGSWHQVVTRDSSFTPSHIFIFYATFPMYIILGVGSLIWAYTRLPVYHKFGVSLPHLLAVVGPFMILPNVGLNEWGHAFWFMEELFGAPLHWGFVILGWTGIALGGVLLQIVLRVNEVSHKIPVDA